MKCLTPKRASFSDLTRFHSDKYIKFLRSCNTQTAQFQKKVGKSFGIGYDSPIFDGLYEFCQISAGASISAAQALNDGSADIAINWAGGLHHARRNEASGFCYVADCVLAILNLLDHFARIMYIDIDIHHGDGVEEAFYSTDRVLTVSFHKFGNFFPGTGNIRDIGCGTGKYYSVNVPLLDGIDDIQYFNIFKPIVDRLVEWYHPSAIVMQCGADSLTGDRLGFFNLSIKGHSKCVEHVKNFGLPLLITGGGGYTVRNCSACWTYETAVLLDFDPAEIFPNERIPESPYMSYFSPDYSFSPLSIEVPDQNSPESLSKTVETVFENIRHLPCAPSLQLSLQSGQILLEESEDDLIEDRLLSLYF